MMASDGKEVLILHERWAESIIKDTCSLGGAVATIALGWWLGSVAMQWLGFCLFGLLCLAYGVHGGKVRMPPQEAADYLRKTYGVSAR